MTLFARDSKQVTRLASPTLCTCNHIENNPLKTNKTGVRVRRTQRERGKMSRKSTKGFKRLENHEMSEFSTFNGGPGGSESEEDLLDLSAEGGHDGSERCYR